jgi:Zn-dependent protease
MDWLANASAWVVPVVLAITLHEAAHGWVAEKFGDDTARQLGRITFNPIKHIDKFGTIVFPGMLLLMGSPILFGYAKPVPVNFARLKPPRLGMLVVALAGVAVNFILAVISALLLHLETFISPEQAPWLYMNLYRSLMINCVLIVFNLIPILPLDGGRVVDSLLSGQAKEMFGKLERYGVWVVLALLILPPMLGMDLAQTVIGAPTYWLVEHILWLTGNTQDAFA